MGRKKSNKNKAAAPGSSGDSPRDTEAETVQSSEPSQSLQIQVPASEVGDGDLPAQLAAAQAEIAELKATLAKKDEEIASLRASKAPEADTTEEMSKLHERLAVLRKEQAEADAAKDAAWKQLKSIVSEISKLALPSSGTPTAA